VYDDFQTPAPSHDRSKIVPSDKPATGEDVFIEAANGKTAGSYTTDGSWNLGGWSTYPSKDELTISAKRPPLVTYNKPKK
jgi:hypothetical protein